MGEKEREVGKGEKEIRKRERREKSGVPLIP
jgi:hypothetical protein